MRLAKMYQERKERGRGGNENKKKQSEHNKKWTRTKIRKIGQPLIRVALCDGLRKLGALVGFLGDFSFFLISITSTSSSDSTSSPLCSRLVLDCPVLSFFSALIFCHSSDSLSMRDFISSRIEQTSSSFHSFRLSSNDVLLFFSPFFKPLEA